MLINNIRLQSEVTSCSDVLSFQERMNIIKENIDNEKFIAFY